MGFKGLARADRARLGIPRGERIVGWGRGADGGVIAATDLALYIDEGERIPWVDIERAVYEPPDLVLGIPGVGARRLPLQDPRDLPQAVRACVTDSVIVSERMELAGGKGALLVARRAGDEVRWSVVLDAGLDPQDPGAREAVERRLGDLRRSLGI